jgi:hypothetical protein
MNSFVQLAKELVMLKTFGQILLSNWATQFQVRCSITATSRPTKTRSKVCKTQKLRILGRHLVLTKMNVRKKKRRKMQNLSIQPKRKTTGKKRK